MQDSILVNKVDTAFKKRFQANPLLIFSPGRINLIGEHTDYNDGFVFPAAIDKGIVCGIQKNDKDYCEVIALDKKESHRFDLNEIVPVKKGWWKNYVLGVVEGVLEKRSISENFDILFSGNIPSGAGLSSSAALENSIVFSLNELFDLQLTKKEMIFISQKAEHDFVGVKCGIMDQFASMFGESNAAILLDCKNLNAEIFPIYFNEYELLLINTNVKHSLADSAYNNRREVCEKVAKMLHVSALREVSEAQLNSIKDQLSKEDFDKVIYVIQENNRVVEASKALQNKNIDKFGQLMFASHDGLQHQYKVSCKELDFLVDMAKENPAVIGARMMGGGFGGCTINLVYKEKSKEYQEQIKKAYAKAFLKECSFYNVHLNNGVQRVHLDKK
jgi:galactokinase